MHVHIIVVCVCVWPFFTIAMHHYIVVYPCLLILKKLLDLENKCMCDKSILHVLDLFTCNGCSTIPVATATLSESNVEGR